MKLNSQVQETGLRIHNGFYSLEFLQGAELNIALCLQGRPIRRHFSFLKKRKREKQVEKSLQVLTETNKSV